LLPDFAFCKSFCPIAADNMDEKGAIIDISGDEIKELKRRYCTWQVEKSLYHYAAVMST